jgi:enoyl-CoA hydratase/carnithine racemase
MYRFFRSFDTDGSVNHIWVQNKGVNCFSSGLEMNDLVNDPDYLRKVFQLSTMIARINKPILGHVKGLVGGAAAYILRTMSSPFGHSNTHLKLDDIDKGWIPICGGTYHLTRMQGDIGTYLALTGD